MRDIIKRAAMPAHSLAATGNKATTERFGANIMPVIREIQASGITTLRGVARALNERGVQSQTGRSWSHVTVRDIIKRSTMATPSATHGEMSE